MISFDQVFLLQQKVESAVQKIVELKSENDALRSKCSELTNALSEKTELLENFYADEKKIESSILNALDRLNTIENSVVSENSREHTVSSENPAVPQSEQDAAPAQNEQQPSENSGTSLFDSENSGTSAENEADPDSTETEDSEQEKFDIF